MIRSAMATVVLVTAATPALADLPAACTQAPTFAAALAQLEAGGWQTQPRDATFTQAQTDALAWTLMTRYVGTDTGGEEIATLLDLQRAAVPGLLARVDGDTTLSRVLLNGDDALTITQTRTAPGRIERSCRLASAGPAPAGLDLIDTSGIEGAPATLAETLTILPEE
ncbi:hypothetical protein MWU52_11415 [Jannaschia sp. S6380]|uniref:hypothetical protein n=1 Tax=Jannaschia sp. S6380 TaxID=2926408 RepID=UPI001FF1BCF0|nr:hypothetical protein [Jannaschia sp. S6380]MCK0168163.1 hypothetical protein [Jannaschia sp. S6380]